MDAASLKCNVALLFAQRRTNYHDVTAVVNAVAAAIVVVVVAVACCCCCAQITIL